MESMNKVTKIYKEKTITNYPELVRMVTALVLRVNGGRVQVSKKS